MRRAVLGVLVGLMLLVAIPVAGGAAPADALPLLHDLFTDHMVVQRDVPAPFWGWTQPGRQVTVRGLGESRSAVADAGGRWTVRVGPVPAGGPHEVQVDDGVKHVVLHDVLVGDVWLCSGQSNMAMGVGAVKDGEQELARADHPRLRLFTVPCRQEADPSARVEGRWLVCTPENAAKGLWNGFSAVGYFFGRDLQADVKVPIGLIHASWGGTPAEAWTPVATLDALPGLEPAHWQMRLLREEHGLGPSEIEARVARWWRENDPGSARTPGWEDPALDDAAWKTMQVPGQWEKAGLPDFDGVVWFRRTVEVPAAWAGRDLVLRLGPVDDRDVTWFDGVRVGSCDVWNRERGYTVPGRLVRPGRHVIAVRVLDTGGDGGFTGLPRQLSLERADDPRQGLPLAGPWRYCATADLARGPRFPLRVGDDSGAPSLIYNGMIAPLVPFALRGTIWYQGETNSSRARDYRRLLTAMIGAWRKAFGVGDFPFLIVQLAAFEAPKHEDWPALREAQLQVMQTVPGTGMAVAVDIGDAKDVHPTNKQEVGRRLALVARAVAYGEAVEGSGPIYRGCSVEGGRVRVRFEHVGGGLVAHGPRLEGFEVAGADGRFVPAEAVVEGEAVVVTAAGVARPVAVRYGWADFPRCNLYNREGLPASPFRSR